MRVTKSAARMASIAAFGLVASAVFAQGAAPTPAAATGVEHVPTTHLGLGDPARAARLAPVVLDAVTDTATGELLTPTQLARRLADVRVLFVGEEHTNGEFHRIQLAVIDALHRAGRAVTVGLEMFPCDANQPLTRWTRGVITESQFLDESRWYETWSYHWGYYRDIFQFARARALDMVGVNVPRDVVSAVRANGFGGLTAAQRRCLPPGTPTPDEQHRTLVRSYFASDDSTHAGLTSEQFDMLYRAQLAWDAALGWNAHRVLAAKPREDGALAAAPIVVVLLGSGHVAYGLGAERQLAPQPQVRVASLIPVVVRAEGGAPIKDVGASYANYVWGVPDVPQPTLPTLGLSLMGRLGKQPMQVIDVGKGSVAEAAGVRVGDVLLALDDTALDSPATLARKAGDYAWGDAAQLRVERAGAPVTLDVAFRRM
jgi:uncharacterized iron-regulated protein